MVKYLNVYRISLLLTLHLGILASGSTDTEFTLSPSNQTTIYGRILDFVCQIPTCSESLFIQMNTMTVVPYMNFSDVGRSQIVRVIPELESREYGGDIRCDGGENYTVRFWIIVNDETLKVVNHVNCKIGSRTVSDNAYIINVTYPETLRESVCTNQELPQYTTNSGNKFNLESELTMTMYNTDNKIAKPAISMILLILCLHATF